MDIHGLPRISRDSHGYPISGFQFWFWFQFLVRLSGYQATAWPRQLADSAPSGLPGPIDRLVRVVQVFWMEQFGMRGRRPRRLLQRTGWRRLRHRAHRQRTDSKVLLDFAATLKIKHISNTKQNTMVVTNIIKL